MVTSLKRHELYILNPGIICAKRISVSSVPPWSFHEFQENHGGTEDTEKNRRLCRPPVYKKKWDIVYVPVSTRTGMTFTPVS